MIENHSKLVHNNTNHTLYPTLIYSPDQIGKFNGVRINFADIVDN